MKTLTVICPVYNEEEVIESFYRELKKVLSGISERYSSRILFVVDPGTDESVTILKQIATQDSAVQIIVLSSRFGHQLSLLAGIDHAESDAVLMMDSDLQHPPALIPAMLAEQEKGYDIVYTIRADSPDAGFFKRGSSRLFYRMVNAISPVRIHESAADFRLISRRVAGIFQKDIRERNLFLRGLFSWVGFRSIGVPFEARGRFAGQSKYSLGRMVSFGLQGVISFSKKPLQAAIYFGFLFAFFGLAIGILTVIQYFVSDSLPSGWATLAVLISMFSGAQLIFLGIIGEYIGAIFDEVKGRPHYIVDELINIASPWDRQS